LELLGRQILRALIHLGQGDSGHSIARGKLKDNPFWPENLAAAAGHLKHERYVVLLPLALSRTKDDKGRVRWTLFGGSEQGPARPFWRSFWRAPREERPPADAIAFFCNLLSEVYGNRSAQHSDPGRAGLRVYAAATRSKLSHWHS